MTGRIWFLNYNMSETDSSIFSWHFSKPEHTVQVETGNTELKDNALQVSGFNVKGKVLSDGYSNLGFLLYNLKGVSLIIITWYE